MRVCHAWYVPEEEVISTWYGLNLRPHPPPAVMPATGASVVLVAPSPTSSMLSSPAAAAAAAATLAAALKSWRESGESHPGQQQGHEQPAAAPAPRRA
eukprot:CAMPEP_0179863484 /NCGR_PEP_ID=MMETSP0982-20121206/15581_1 /TAXON_ID=483367 /ORGANISM="non described non described, Strain CCMP 2436" /LENGTH=97 /DNA_ID=CAMNT_0021751619 /DNA_START=2204 /DNA_END=2497 /DNA_ORIENTATION=-